MSPSGVLWELVREVVKPKAPARSASIVSVRISAMSSGVAGSRPNGAVAHHVDAQRQMRGLRADVDRARTALQRIHEIGEALPLPGQARGQHGVGNLLDALHQIHQRAAMMRLHRREADAAIAEHHGGDAMPARRRQQRIPHRLPVIVRMHVDPSGRDQQARGVDLAPARPLLTATAAMRPSAIATSPVKAAVPVPSMMVPPRITMSYMGAAPVGLRPDNDASGTSGVQPAQL